MLFDEKIRVIGFDLDDTLWPLENTIKRANQEMWEFLSNTFPAIRHFFQPSFCSIDEHHSFDVSPYKHQISLARLKMTQYMLQKSGATTHQIDYISKQAMEIFLDYRHQLEFYPGAISCLHAIKKDFVLISISNGNADVNRIPELKNIFHYSLNAEHIKCSKPSAEIFNHALQKLNCKPQHVVYIGNHLEDDVIGAWNANINAIWFNWQRQNSSAKFNHQQHYERKFIEVNNFKELGIILKSLNKN